MDKQTKLVTKTELKYKLMRDQSAGWGGWGVGGGGTHCCSGEESLVTQQESKRRAGRLGRLWKQGGANKANTEQVCGVKQCRAPGE